MAFSFSYRGIRSEDLQLEVLDISRSILPPNDALTIDIPGRAGEFFLRSEYGLATFNIEILIVKQSTLEAIQEQARLVANFLDATQGLGVLIFDDETDRSYQAIISGATDVEQITRFRRGTITFIAPFPHAEKLTSLETSLDGFVVSFSRGSVAYDLDGNQIATGVERYTDAQFEQGILCESETSNILTSGESRVEVIGDWATINASDIAMDIKNVFIGNYSIRCRTQGDTANEGVESLLPTSVSSTTVYTLSCQCTASQQSTLLIYVDEYNGAAYVKTESAVITVKEESEGLTRMELTFTTSGTTDGVIFGVRTNFINFITFWVDGFQLEQANTGTSWTLGGTSRAKEEIKLTNFRDYMRKAGFATIGTIEMRFKRLWTKSDSYAGLFEWGQYSSPITLDRIAIFHGPSQPGGLDALSLYLANGSTATSKTITVTLTNGDTVPGQYYYVAVRWNLVSPVSELWIDVYDYTNEKLDYLHNISTIEVGASFSGFADAYLGELGRDFFVNSMIDEFRATPRQLSDQEILDNISTVRPIPKNEDGQIKITFDEDFNLYTTDASNEGTAPVNYTITNVIQVAATYIKITLVETSQFIHVIKAAGSWSINDVIVFDAHDKTISVNGVVDMSILSLDSEFFQIPKDDVAFNIATDGTISSKVDYKPIWL